MKAIVTLLTDFGTHDHYVAAVKGVLLSINPDLTLVDITHEISPQNIKQGGLGGAVLELFNDMDVRDVRIRRLGLPDKFIGYGPIDLLKEKYGLDKMGIFKQALDFSQTSGIPI